MKVLVVGGGGREHALCWAIAGSPLADRLWCAPGNAGIAREAECVPIGAADVDGIVRFARDQGVDFVVVGPEAPLVAGLVDRLEAERIRAFGPSARAAALEASKGFTKDLCARAGIPSGAYRRFREPGVAKRFARELGAPVVVKADGLASGKGVVIAESAAAADAAIDDMLVRARFGAAGAEIVVEEFLKGDEASFFALVDGEHALPLAAAQDHKRVGDGDTGPNTGGMGAYSPAPCVTPAVAEQTMARIIKPTIAAMREAGRPYRGVLYAGLMLTADGPKLLEYNVRFGDPECQVLMPRLMSDLLTALVAARDGELAHFDLRWRAEAALTVVMAARGYPGEVLRGSEIRGLAEAEKVDGVTIFHAGTRAEGERVLADGGRVLGVTALGRTIKEAQTRAYAAVDRIDWPEGFCRRDIGRRAV
jgi:phosphoribosylamine--glycine ligase